MSTYYNKSICIVKPSSEQTLIEMSISNGVDTLQVCSRGDKIFLPILIKTEVFQPLQNIIAQLPTWVFSSFRGTRYMQNHYTLLGRFYSVDFLWWFDRNVNFLSLLGKTADKMMTTHKKIVKWQKFETALCDSTKKLFLLNFVSPHSLNWD